MPHGNRVSSSSALKMTGIWTNTIGYDPYAAEGGGADAEDEANAYEQAQGLMALAKLSNQGVGAKPYYHTLVQDLSYVSGGARSMFLLSMFVSFCSQRTLGCCVDVLKEKRPHVFRRMCHTVCL